ncbi:MAG: response regulator [Methylococcales bacterium]|jgi:tetratricopeptide (TPR) repeat protein|nr:response regulator [Methylococcales bacterium]MBT7410805.1 response regulator [Methylococcales bacterium]
MPEDIQIFANTKFLIIDDFSNYRNMLKSSILRRCGAEDIDDTSTGENALKLIKQKDYDVILCDYNLGEGQNGQQVLEEAKQRGLINYDTVFIMVTAENAVKMVMSACEYHPDGYLNKPFTKEMLQNRIHIILKKKQIFRDIADEVELENYKKAIKLCDKQIHHFPKYSIDIAKLKAEIFIKMDKSKYAQKIYEKINEVRPLPWSMIGLAKIHVANHKFETAEEILQQMIGINKNSVEAYDLFAVICEHKKDFEGAKHILKRAAEISPHAIKRQKNLARMALESKDLGLAETAYKKTIQLGEHSYLKTASDKLGLAKTYSEQDKYEDAIETLQDVRKEYWESPNHLLHTQIIESMIYFNNEEEEASKALFEEAIKHFIGRADEIPFDVSSDMAKLCFLNEEEEMGNAITEALSTIGDNVDAWDQAKKYKYLQLNREAISLYLNNNLDEAIPMFEKVATELPDNISINMNAAQVLIYYVTNFEYDEEKMTRARGYLDVAKNIDQHNEKYLKLEEMYRAGV